MRAARESGGSDMAIASSILKKLAVSSALILSIGLISKSTLADDIAIQNASFETTSGYSIGCGTGCFYNPDSIPGWTITGSGGEGSFDPNSTYYNLPLPDGSTVAYSNGGTISQDLGVAAQTNSSYTLTVWVGDRLDNENTTYSIALLAGSTTLCSFSGANADIGAGSFAPETCTFSGLPSVPSGDLSIVLTSNGTQTDFDYVSLSDPPVVPTPEPGSLVLTGAGLLFVGLMFGYSKRNQFRSTQLS
jgi:hypothetical protein